MKALIILITILITSIDLTSQQKINIEIESGLIENQSTVILSYHTKTDFIDDTIYKNESGIKGVEGLSDLLIVKIPKREIKEFLIIVKNQKYKFLIDRIKNNSILKIDYRNGHIHFSLFQRRRFNLN